MIKRGVALCACKPLIYKAFLSIPLKEIYKKESPEREEVHPGDQGYDVIVVDAEEPENGVIAENYEELLERMVAWNYEFIQDSEVVGEQREQVLKDMEMIDDLLGCSREGIPIGYPTVKELIAILSKLPQDYKVTCCGAENYLYLCANDKYITIDCEHYWG